MPNDLANPSTAAHFWYRALSNTTVIGRPTPAAATARSSAQTDSAFRYVWFATRISRWLTACSAPNTLYRLRPDAARTNSREAPHPPEERGVHEVGAVREVHVPAA